MNSRNGALAQVAALAQCARIGVISLIAASCSLGCAADVAGVESRSAVADELRPGAQADSRSGAQLEARSANQEATADPLAASVGILVEHRPPIAVPDRRGSVFGAVRTDAQGRLSIAPADAIRNAENEMYGWLIWVGDSSEPVRWSETLIGPEGGQPSGEGGGTPPAHAVTFDGAMLPVEGFIYSQWVLGAGEAPGRYRLVVSLFDGRTESFAFSLGPPQDACPAMRVLLNWWSAKHSLEGDPGNRDVSERVMEVLGARLAHHGFASADLEDAYWYVMASAARRSDDREIAYGHVVMRAIADFQGKARRYSAGTSRFEGLVDYGILFESPMSELDAFVRTLADKFAAVLTPHARHACADWWSGQREEERRLEAIRSALEEEILRVRERRAEREKRLELEVDR